MPKRKIAVEYVLAPQDFPRTGTVEEINSYLETYFNGRWDQEGEPLNLVSDYFWQTETGEEVLPQLHDRKR